MMDSNRNVPHRPSGLERIQSELLCKALGSSDITASELWLRYLSNGGTVGEYEVDAYVQSLLSLPAIQRDLLAHTVNEIIDELPPGPRAPSMKDLTTAHEAGSPME